MPQQTADFVMFTGTVALCLMALAGSAPPVTAASSGMVFFQSPFGAGQAQVWRFGGKVPVAPKAPAMRRSSAADYAPTAVANEATVAAGAGEVAVPPAEELADIEEFQPNVVAVEAEELDEKTEESVEDSAEESDDDDTAEAAGGEEDDDSFAFGPWKSPVFAKKPAFFPMNFGRTTGGAVAVANSYSVRGSAVSQAVAHGSPARRRTTSKPTL